MQTQLSQLAASLEGLLFFDNSVIHTAQLMAYSTDASVYQEKPLAVAVPKSNDDIKKLIAFAHANKTTLIPRAAGTSLSGQVVGSGIVVDISKYFTNIIEVNKEERWVRVQPGVIRDDLNYHLKQFGLMFGPETSTANRAMIGGMLGNNSCGLHSIVWGAVRDHVLEVKTLLSDGSEAVFTQEDIRQTKQHSALKQKIYTELDTLLSDAHNRQLIATNFPDVKVHRRNTGYALDSLLAMQPYTETGEPFNLCKLIAGSEGTLAFVTEIKVNLLDLPPKEIAVVCIHCSSIIEAMKANVVAMRHKPVASELVDKYIMDFTINHPEYSKNRFFIEGDPAAILMVEFMDNDTTVVKEKAAALIAALQQEQLGFAYPVLYNEQTKYAWDVRKAGLGLLRNIIGDAQPVNLIEDCAVTTDDLPSYIADLQQVLAKHKVNASYYAHAGAGEVHVEPIVNLKSEEGLKTFRGILADTVELVKKYKGSLSGEHGDGRLRGEYIPAVVGEETYKLFQQVKNIFDPNHIFNAGKITGTPLYRYPTLSFAAQVLTVVGLGIARAAIDEVLGMAAGRASVTGAPNLGERVYVQLEIAKIEAELRAARAWFYEAIDEVWQVLVAGGKPSDHQVSMLRLSTTHASRVGADVARRAQMLSGGTGVYESSPLAAQVRDAQMITQHAFMGDITYQNAGAMLFGLKPLPGYL